MIVVIAASFGIGAAIESSGLAADLASVLVEPFGTASATSGCSSGSSSRRWCSPSSSPTTRPPCCSSPSRWPQPAQAGLESRPFAIAIAIGASSSFLTPIGYQTNTMVYGIGGYRFSDYARLGFPLSIVMIIVSMLFIPLAWPLH